MTTMVPHGLPRILDQRARFTRDPCGGRERRKIVYRRRNPMNTRTIAIIALIIAVILVLALFVF